ncbi:hypothetical protein BG004_003849 [Podila humilis]|nr:hypothetical protein BG004_003849 [Podila humilis]
MDSPQHGSTGHVWKLQDASAGGGRTLKNLSSTLKPPESNTPLPNSPSQRSIEKAIAQKFATLGMDQNFEIYSRSMHYSQARSVLGMTLGISRGSAAVINFDCGLILFSVCRNLISVLRSTFLNSIVPFDKNILFHKTVAWSIVFFSIIHCLGHYVNYHRMAKKTDDKPEHRSAPYLAFLSGPGFTGHVLLLILFIMVASSAERVRRKGFEMFWYTHHLFVLFFVTLMYHGAFCFIRADNPPHCKSSPGSYKFILGSLVVYLIERTFREIRARKPTAISKIVLHPSKVVEVQVVKDNFRAKAGQYVFLNCPDISKFEWHPFTITSAPEEDYVSVHIRIVGDWTTSFAKRLGCSFDDDQQFWIEELMSRSRPHETSGSSSGVVHGSGYDGHVSPSIAKFRSNPSVASVATTHYRGSEAMTLPRVLLDGPYGSPSEDAFNYEIAVLVGAGIGVTPFASVLKHIWYSVMQPTKIITLRKVYFLWAFEWFQDLLIALEEQNMSDFLEIRSYLTGELGAEELNTILLEARASAAAAADRHQKRKRESGSQAQAELDSSGNTHYHQSDIHDALAESGLDRDAITGLRSPTYYGRPNFDKIFGELAQAHPPEHGQVGVFFCGPKPLGKTLHRCARNKTDTKNTMGPTKTYPDGTTPRVAIVGAGMSGLCAAIQLQRQLQLTTYTIFELEADVGGTWHNNTYPGCALDAPAYLYNYSFAPNHDWSKLYVNQEEVLAYFKAAAKTYNVYDKIMFNTRVKTMRWHDLRKKWTMSWVDTNSGIEGDYEADFVIHGAGLLRIPKFPQEFNSFEGLLWHSAKWDHSVDLTGKRVGVVGNNASGVQIISAIASKVENLEIYGRSQSYITPAWNREYGPFWRFACRHVPFFHILYTVLLHIAYDQKIIFYHKLAWYSLLHRAFAYILTWLHRLIQLPRNPTLRRKVTPDHEIASRRIILSSTYYPTLLRDNVSLHTDDIVSIKGKTIETKSGSARELDVLILATGFDHRFNFVPGYWFGRGGVDIAESWGETPGAFNGTFVQGSPNFFLLGSYGSVVAHFSVTQMVETQVRQLIQTLSHMMENDLVVVEAKEEATTEYLELMDKRMDKLLFTTKNRPKFTNSKGQCRVFYSGSCTDFMWRLRHLDPEKLRMQSRKEAEKELNT